MPDAGRSAMRGFLFADLRGYTDFVERYGDHAAARLLEVYRDFVRAAVAEFDGAEIKTEGDSFYVAFTSIAAAVRCGLRIVELARDGLVVDGLRPAGVGVGIHAGETVETGEGYVGSAVNIAARICARAGAGEVLVSDTVRSLTRTFAGLGFVTLGPQDLKGVAEPVVLYRVLAEGEVPPATIVSPPGRSRRRVGAGVAAIAVVVVLALGAATVLRPGANAPPSNGPPSSPLSGATPAPRPTVAPFPTLAEADLLGRLPIAVTRDADCGRIPSDEQTPGSVAGVRCTLPPGSGADTVWFEVIDPTSAVLTRYSRIIGERAIEEGDCATGATAWQSWELRGFLSGHLVCYDTPDAARLLWTYEAQGILARADRPDADRVALFEWWDRTANLLRY